MVRPDDTLPARSRRLAPAGLALALAAGLLIGGAFVATTSDASPPPETSHAIARPAPSEVRGADAQAGIDLARGLSDAFGHAADRVGPSVVTIQAKKNASANAGGGREDLLRRFFGPRAPLPQQRGPMRGVGSGVIVSADGYILTNNHVVAGADELTVVLAGDRELDARLVGSDPETDVAVIKVDAEDLPAAELGDSDDLRVGQWVIAVGNPFQLRSTVTAGIVSAQGRAEVGLAAYESYIQTDASINPGNSGGALADLEGRVVGINTAISSPSGGSVGIGFAIPINMARRVMDELISDGSVSRGFLALLPQDIDEDLAGALGLESTRGALVADVTADGPADRAGIRRGDVIVRFGGAEVEDSRDLRNRVADADPGAEVAVEVLRDGKRRSFDVELGERPRQAIAQAGEEGGDGAAKLGLTLQAVTPDIARQLGLDDASGVVVVGVEPGGAAEDAGIRRGDVIVEAGRRPIDDLDDFQSAVRGLESGDRVALLVRRGGGTVYLGLRVP